MCLNACDESYKVSHAVSSAQTVTSTGNKTFTIKDFEMCVNKVSYSRNIREHSELTSIMPCNPPDQSGTSSDTGPASSCSQPITRELRTETQHEMYPHNTDFILITVK